MRKKKEYIYTCLKSFHIPRHNHFSVATFLLTVRLGHKTYSLLSFFLSATVKPYPSPIEQYTLFAFPSKQSQINEREKMVYNGNTSVG